jgi:hypothetical protein
MADWVNNGSCQDLSGLARDSMWVTSQAAGNRQSKPDNAMTAPGSSPVDRELPEDQMADPTVETGPVRPVGSDGKPRASATTGDWRPGPVAWSKTTTPDVVRES